MHIILIHTENYSGNFERELTAFMTGETNDCEKAREIAQLYKEEGNPDFSIQLKRISKSPDFTMI